MNMKFWQQDPEVLRSGEELRDRSWAAIERGRVNYAPKFLFNGVHRRAGAHDPADGLIRTTAGYYRLAVDTRTECADGSRNPVYVLLHTYERQQFECIYKDGRMHFPEVANGDQDIYGCTARRAGGPRFLEDIIHDRSYLEKVFHKDLNLHATEKPDNPHVVKFANGRAGFGVFETPDGKYRVRYFKNLRSEWDEASRFARVEEAMPHGRVGKFFSLGRDIRDFDSYDEAFAYVRNTWKNSSQVLFQGKSLEPDSLKSKIAAYAIGFMDRREWRRVTILGALSVVAIVVNKLILGNTVRGAGWLLGITGAISAGARLLSTNLVKRWMARRLEQDKIIDDSIRPLSEVNLIDSYLMTADDNKKRFLRRVDRAVLQYLRPLSHDESKIKYSDSKLRHIANPMRAMESLSSAPYRYYGAVFDATHAQQGILAAVYPNGLVSLTHINSENQEVRRYMTYSDKFNLVSGDAKHLDRHKLPSDGPIHKITHRVGDDFRYVGMRGDAFIADLADKAGTGTQHLRVFGLPLLDLFNVADPGPVQPQNIPAEKIPEEFFSGPPNSYFK